MIFKDIKEAIGSVLIDVIYYVNRNPVDCDADQYGWDVKIFDKGLVCFQEECYEYDGCHGTYITKPNRHMPEELKKIIEKHMETS